MFHSSIGPRKKSVLLSVLCGNAAGTGWQVGCDVLKYPFPDLSSSDFLEVQTLKNPTIDEFQDVQRSVCPDYLYFHGQRLEKEDKFGSLIWGTTYVSDPEVLSTAIDPPLPSIVYLELPNSENISEALRLKGVPYVIYWKNAFTSYAASHFCQALFSALQCSQCHAWDAFQFAYASFRLYCFKNNCNLPALYQDVEFLSPKLGPCLSGDSPKIDLNLLEKAMCGGEFSTSCDPAIKIHDEYVNVQFLVCGNPSILDACVLGPLEDGLSALLNIEIRGSKLLNKVRALPHPFRSSTLSQGDYRMRCGMVTSSSAYISLLVSGSLQTCVDDLLVENLIKNELIEKRQLVRALPCDESKFSVSQPPSTACIAAGASVFEVCMKIPSWAAQIFKYLACEFSYRSLVQLGIASIHGISVVSFEEDDADRLIFFFDRKRQDLLKEDALLHGLSSKIFAPRPSTMMNAEDLNILSPNNHANKQLEKPTRIHIQGLNIAAMRPVPFSKRRKIIPLPASSHIGSSYLNETDLLTRKSNLCSFASPGKYSLCSGNRNCFRSASSIHGSSLSRSASSLVNEHSICIEKYAYSIKRRSLAKSDLAQQRISSNPIPLKKHECNRSSIHGCSEEAFLMDLVHFLILRGHHRLVPHGGISDFPDAVLNSQRLDLFNLYKEVVTRGGYYVGNGINWRGQVFSNMRNHSTNNKMTGITYALKRHYETYLLEYELAHDDVSVDLCILCQSGTPGDWLCCSKCSKGVHFDCDERPIAPFMDYSKSSGLDYICPQCGS